MKIVLDTNVLVSSLLSPFGGPSQILQLISLGKLTLLLDQRIFQEYKDVLARKQFHFPAELRNRILERISEKALWITPEPVSLHLPDPEDRKFIEAAISGKADALVTGNKKHFPVSQIGSIRIFLPSEFLEHMTGQNYFKISSS